MCKKVSTNKILESQECIRHVDVYVNKAAYVHNLSIVSKKILVLLPCNF